MRSGVFSVRTGHNELGGTAGNLWDGRGIRREGDATDMLGGKLTFYIPFPSHTHAHLQVSFALGAVKKGWAGGLLTLRCAVSVPRRRHHDVARHCGGQGAPEPSGLAVGLCVR